METINGIDFTNWAAACAHLTQGMSEGEISKILGIEIPVWQETTEKWAARLGDLMAEDMNVATQYGDIFANPKVGKFANAGTDTPSLDEVLQLVPDYNAYKKIFWHQSVAAKYGIDAVTIIESYDLNLQTWSQLNMHYMKWHNEYMNIQLGESDPEEYNRRYEEILGIEDTWRKHWEAHYKENAVDLGGDIDF